jgi:hypothetical protein
MPSAAWERVGTIQLTRLPVGEANEEQSVTNCMEVFSCAKKVLDFLYSE